jgi:hypothetical protein
VRAEKWVLEWCRHERGGLTRPEPRQYIEPKIAPQEGKGRSPFPSTPSKIRHRLS